MQNIESYNSSYPLAYYEVGTVYSFYGQTPIKGVPATSDVIQKYAPVLDALVAEEQKNAIKPVKESIVTAMGYSTMNRFYAVIIEKVKSDNNTHLVVMFCNKYNGRSEYYTKKYSVNHGCTTDGKDLIPVSTCLSFKSKNNSKVGGITLVNKDKKIGRITRANGKNTSTSSIGRITKVHQLDTPNEDISKMDAKVGGITLVKEQKVGGITRVKK